MSRRRVALLAALLVSVSAPLAPAAEAQAAAAADGSGPYFRALKLIGAADELLRSPRLGLLGQIDLACDIGAGGRHGHDHRLARGDAEFDPR